MSKLVMHMRFADDGERQRYAALRTDPVMQDATSFGAAVARQYVVPLIVNHAANGMLVDLGTREIRSVEAVAAEFRDAGMVDYAVQLGRPMNDDERFMYGVGFTSFVADAKAQAQRTLAAAEKMGQAHALAEASRLVMNEARAMLDMPEVPPIPLPQAPAHLLSIGSRRPLRPEDCAALPSTLQR